MKRKIVAMLTLATLALTACSAANNDGNKKTGELTTYNMFIGTPGLPPSATNEVVQKIEEKTGVRIDFEFLVGDLDQKAGVMLASGDYPDLINPSQARSRFMQAEALLPLEDLLPKYPNLHKHFSPYYDKMKAASPDGSIYLLDIWGVEYGEAIITSHSGPAFWIQKDVLEWAGYPNPTTLDEYFALIESYATAHPTIDGQPTLGFEVLSFDWRAFCLKNAPQHLIGGPNDGSVFVNQDTLKSEVYADKDYAKEYYRTLNEMFQKGFISPETFTQNYDQYLSKISSGRVLGMFDQHWNFQDAENVIISEDKMERTYVPLGLTYDGYEQWYKEPLTFVGGNGMGISATAKDVDGILTYIDALLEEDIQKMLSWGIEGKDHYVENGRMLRTLEQKLNFEDPTWVVNNIGGQLWYNFPKMEGQFSDGNATSPSSQREELIANQHEYDKEFLSHYGFAVRADFLTAPGPMPDYYPVWGFTIEEGSPAKIAEQNINEVQERYLPRVIMADNFESAWADYMVEFGKIDYRPYEEEVDKQIAERMNR